MAFARSALVTTGALRGLSINRNLSVGIRPPEFPAFYEANSKAGSVFGRSPGGWLLANHHAPIMRVKGLMRRLGEVQRGSVACAGGDATSDAKMSEV